MFVGVVGAEDGSADAAILLWVRVSLLHVGLLVVCGGEGCAVGVAVSPQSVRQVDPTGCVCSSEVQPPACVCARGG